MNLRNLEPPPVFDDSFLKYVEEDKVPDVLLQNEMVRAKVTRVYDGDTFTVIFLIGNVPIKYKVRLMGIDTPELRTRNKLEKQAAQKCRDVVKSLIEGHIITICIKSWDKYGGRLVCEAYTNPTTNLSQLLLNMGLAKPYDGKTKKMKWTRKELHQILDNTLNL